MDTYADSSFLVSLISEDVNTERARRYVDRHVGNLPFTPLHRLEVRNAIRLAVKFGQFDRSRRFAALSEIDEGFRASFFIHFPIDWTDCLRRAEALSARHTETLGCRAMDILHVAIALESATAIFFSFDANQRALAAAEGLTVQP